MNEKLWPLQFIANGEYQTTAGLTDEQIKSITSIINGLHQANQRTQHTPEELSAWGTSELIELILRLQETRA